MLEKVVGFRGFGRAIRREVRFNTHDRKRKEKEKKSLGRSSETSKLLTRHGLDSGDVKSSGNYHHFTYLGR